MGKRSKIPVSEGEKLSKKYDAPIVIVFTILDRGDTFNVMTYGASKALCRHAASLGVQFSKAVLERGVIPEPTEPENLPDVPANWINSFRP